MTLPNRSKCTKPIGLLKVYAIAPVSEWGTANITIFYEAFYLDPSPLRSPPRGFISLIGASGGRTTRPPHEVLDELPIGCVASSFDEIYGYKKKIVDDDDECSDF